MQSHDVQAIIRQHAEQLDAQTPPIVFGELRPPGEPRARAFSTRRPGAVRGVLVAAAVALGIIVFVGAGALLLTLISEDTGPADEPSPTSLTTTTPDTTLPPTTTPAPPTTVPLVEVPTSWWRLETEMIAGSIAAGPDGFVSIGRHPTYGLWFSEDGAAWNRQLSLEESFSGGDIAVGPDGYVATVHGAVEWGVGIWLSEDGRTWVMAESVEDGTGTTERTESGDPVAGTYSAMHGVTYGAGLYVGVGEVWDFDDGVSHPRAAVWTSLDGSVWTRLPDAEVFDGPYEQVMESVTFGEGGFVAVGWDTEPSGDNTAGAIWQSPDGLAWVRIPHDDELFGDFITQEWTDLHDVTYGDNGYVATGVPGVLVSTDGLAWNRIDAPVLGGSNGFGDVTFGGGVYLIVGSEWSDGLTTAAVWYSTDATTWTRVAHDDAVFGEPAGTHALSVAFSGGRFVSVGYNQTEVEGGYTEDGYVWIGQPADD